jgi:hypothetical protein
LAPVDLILDLRSPDCAATDAICVEPGAEAFLLRLCGHGK